MSRDYSIDLLRISAALAVVLLHSSVFLNAYPVNSIHWMIANVSDSITRWAVPVFVMISGAFLLKKEITLKLLYGKYIKHLLILLISWNFLYNLPIIKTCFPLSIEGVLSLFLFPGPAGYQLWYLYMLIGVYMLIPFIKKIVDGGGSKYLLVLWFLTGVLLSGVDFTFLGDKSKMWTEYIICFPFVIRFVGYFVLGYYLYNEVILSRRQRVVVYCAGILGILSTIIGTYVLSSNLGTLVEYFYDYHNITVMLASVAIFVFFKYNKIFVTFTNNSKVRNIVGKLSNLSLGVYLVHTLILGQLYSQVFSLLECYPFITIPALSITTVVLSFGVTYVLSRIPYIRVLVK